MNGRGTNTPEVRMPRYKYTDEDIKEAVETSISLAESLRKLKLLPTGGNYLTLKIKIKKLNLNTSHFKGQGWSKDTFTVPLNAKRSNDAIKKHLVSKKGHKCETCKLSTWNGNPIPLELEHIDGNSLNNEEGNLMLLCPNCHAFTPTYRRIKKKHPSS
jgi:hypothetical protein